MGILYIPIGKKYGETMIEDNSKKKEGNNQNCTCDEALQPDAWPTGLCPVHGLTSNRENKEYGGEHVVVTDAHRISKDFLFMSGWKFRCPNCGVDSILHFMRCCPNCTVHIIMQSEFVRDMIRQANARGRATTNHPNK